MALDPRHNLSACIVEAEKKLVAKRKKEPKRSFWEQFRFPQLKDIIIGCISLIALLMFLLYDASDPTPTYAARSARFLVIPMTLFIAVQIFNFWRNSKP